jgi:hypothetical protein
MLGALQLPVLLTALQKCNSSITNPSFVCNENQCLAKVTCLPRSFKMYGMANKQIEVRNKKYLIEPCPIHLLIFFTLPPTPYTSRI